MRSIISAVVTSMVMVGAIATSEAAAQTALQVPQSIRIQHEQIVGRLANLAKSKGPVGAAAQKALTVLKGHYAKEEEFVLPPLGLLPRIAKGDISKDMEPAIAMAERTKAALSEFQNDHIQLTSLMNELIEVARKGRSEELMLLATRIANQSLNDIEVAQPTTIFIGEYLRQRLSKGQ